MGEGVGPRAVGSNDQLSRPQESGPPALRGAPPLTGEDLRFVQPPMALVLGTGPTDETAAVEPVVEPAPSWPQTPTGMPASSPSPPAQAARISPCAGTLPVTQPQQVFGLVDQSRVGEGAKPVLTRVSRPNHGADRIPERQPCPPARLLHSTALATLVTSFPLGVRSQNAVSWRPDSLKVDLEER